MSELPEPPLFLSRQPPNFLGKPLVLLPKLAVGQVLAIATVQLAAGNVPWQSLRVFYQGMLNFTEVSCDGEHLEMRFASRRVMLRRDFSNNMLSGRGTEDDARPVAPQVSGPGLLMLTVRRVDDAPPILRQYGLAWEMLHADFGLNRTILLRDAAGNDVRLMETRAF